MNGPASPVVLVIMGVSGSGKSTVAARVAEATGWDMLEGDDLHSPGNVAKMAAGRPLEDADRAPWLAAVAAWIDDHVRRGRPGIVTCSALRRRYRDVLAGEQVRFVHLAGAPELIRARLRDRRGHFMPETLLDSQRATLEPLEADERGIVLDVAAEPADLAAEILAWVRTSGG